MKRLVLCSLVLPLALILCMSSGVLYAAEGFQDVIVKRTGDKCTINGQRLTISIDRKDFGIIVEDGSCAWNILPAANNDLSLEIGNVPVKMSFTDAQNIIFSPYKTGFKTGFKIELSQFIHEGKCLDLKMYLFVCIERHEGNVVFDIAAEEGDAVIKECLWPKGFDPETVDYTVMPYMQGMLLPRNWQKKVRLYNSMTYGRGLYMPWWGHQKDKSAVLVILETPDDAGCNFEHPAGGPTKIEPRWMHSLGKLSYPRSLRLCFLEEGNYVSIAKRYRRYVKEKGHFVSLKEKIVRSPLVEKLIGSPIIHTGILTHIQPASNYYNKEDASKNHRFTTFSERAEQLKALSEKGITQAYLHLDGWGFRGYDNLHPDILPPSPEAGGWEGMKHFAEVCDQLGIIFAVHDQYRDYFHDADSYDPNLTLIMENGERPFGNTWYGGDQSVLCPRMIPGHVMKNHETIHAHGVKLRGAYLDVFAVVPPEECYNPEHPVTRTQCMKFRGDGLDIIRSFGGVVSSEEPSGWAIPYIDLVHHGPYPLDPNPGGGSAVGIPIPLFNLVYHDALITPWFSGMNKGGWGIPDTDQSYLHCLANAGMPYLSIVPNGESLSRVKNACALNKRVAFLEMVNHEFLDETYRAQRTTFADGTEVTVNFDEGTFKISPSLD